MGSTCRNSGRGGSHVDILLIIGCLLYRTGWGYWVSAMRLRDQAVVREYMGCLFSFSIATRIILRLNVFLSCRVNGDIARFFI